MHPRAGARTPVALVDTPSSPLALCTAGCSGARQLAPPGLLVIIRQRRPLTQVLLTVALHREAPGLIPLARQCGGAGGNGGSSGSRGPGRGLRGTSGNKNDAFSQSRVFVPVSRTSLSRHDM